MDGLTHGGYGWGVRERSDGVNRPLTLIIGTYRRAATARLQLRRVVGRHEAGATLFPRCRNFLQSHAAVVAIGSPIPSEVLSTAMNRSRFPGQ